MEFVEMYLPMGRLQSIRLRRAKTVKVPRAEYEGIRDLIFDVLKIEKQISLERLIDVGKEKLRGHRQDGQLSWLIVQVKNDLEFRDQIQTTFDYNRNQQIRLRNAAF